MKKFLLLIILAGVVLAAVAASYKLHPVPEQKEATNNGRHVYATWDTMEFDKCVCAWLIARFIDKDAIFKFYPQGTEITEEIPFDVPGAKWSRKHRQCSSQCVLEEIKTKDAAMEKIVAIAGHIELNFWQLDSMPQARECHDAVRAIIDKTPDRLKCYEETGKYFDQLYDTAKKP
jgi:hypothetical protein